MKTIKIHLSKCLVTTLCSCVILYAHAQGTTQFISNLAEASSGSASAGNNAWLAQAFFNNGSNFDQGRDRGFRLDSVQLLMSNSLGNPIGFSISVYNSANRSGGPGSLVGTLNGIAPTTSGIYTYSNSNITLASSSSYYIVMTSGSPLASGVYSWNIANTTNFSSNNGWVMAPFFDSSLNGITWTRDGNMPLQFAINATAIPEPSLLALVGLGGLCLASRLKRWRQFSFQLFTHEQHRRVLSH